MNLAEVVEEIERRINDYESAGRYDDDDDYSARMLSRAYALESLLREVIEPLQHEGYVLTRVHRDATPIDIRSAQTWSNK